MIYRVVLRGRLEGPLALGRFSGLAARGAVLKWLSDGGYAEYVSQLHDGKRPKELTVGPIYINGKLAKWPAVYGKGTWVEVPMGAVGHVLDMIKQVAGSNATLLVEGAPVAVEELEFSLLEPSGDPPETFAIRFLTPTRFARAPAMRRKKAIFDLFPSARLVAVAAAIHAKSILDETWQKRLFGHELTLSTMAKLAKWAYTYVYPRYLKLRSEVVYVKDNPQIGVVGCVQYQIASKSKTRQLFWRLLQFAEVMGLGNGKSYGLGHIKIQPNCNPQRQE